MDAKLEKSLRAEFWRVKAEHDAIMKRSGRLKEEAAKFHEKIEKIYDDEIRPRAEKIREIETPVFKLAKEMSRLVSVLEGKTGSGPE